MVNVRNITFSYPHTQENVLEQAREMMNEQDVTILVQRGVRQLTSKEREYYESLGISCFYSSIDGIQDVEKLIELTKNKTICVMGQSGVGKSTMLNKIDSSFSFQEGDYQVIKGRGKHVTKSVTLIPYNNGFIGDTPGFSSFELDLTKADIAENFPGFSLYSHDCKYRDCLHTNEDKNICNVCFRYNEDEQKLKHYSNYTKLLEDAKESIYGRK